MFTRNAASSYSISEVTDLVATIKCQLRYDWDKEKIDKGFLAWLVRMTEARDPNFIATFEWLDGIIGKK
jgi:hypothetical protein